MHKYLSIQSLRHNVHCIAITIGLKIHVLSFNFFHQLNATENKNPKKKGPHAQMSPFYNQ